MQYLLVTTKQYINFYTDLQFNQFLYLPPSVLLISRNTLLSMHMYYLIIFNDITLNIFILKAHTDRARFRQRDANFQFLKTNKTVNG
jgi:hypothetical protein